MNTIVYLRKIRINKRQMSIKFRFGSQVIYAKIIIPFYHMQMWTWNFYVKVELVAYISTVYAIDYSDGFFFNAVRGL